MRIDSANLVATTILSGSFEVTGSPVPGSTSTYDLGASSSFWRNIYATNLTGSLTKLSDGTSYLIAGNGVQITTSSAGAVTITSTASGANYVAGSSTQVQFNDGGTFGADGDFTFDKNSNLLKATNISGSLTGSNVLAGQIVLTGTGGVLSGSNLFFWDNTNVRVGLGTSSTATHKLTVYEDVSSTLSIGVINPSTNSSATSRLHLGAQGGDWNIENLRSGGVLSFKFNTTEYLRINNVGNVGIGTNDSNGNRLAISGGNLSVTGSILPGATTTYDLGSATYRWRDLYARTGSFSGDVTISGDLTVNGTQFIVNTQVVEIEDNAILLNAGPTPASTGGIYVADTTTGITGSLLWDAVTDQWKAGKLGSEVTLVSGSGTTNYLSKWTGANGLGNSVIHDDGTNVGIGTTATGDKLAVNGSMSVTGSVQPGSDVTYTLGNTTKRWLNVVSNALTGSLTKLSDGTTDYLQAGSNIAIATGSNGAVTISTTGLASTTAQYLTLAVDASLSSERVFAPSTGLKATDGGAGGNYTLTINDSIVATVSGTTFTGVTNHNAGLSGSLTKLTDGTSYLIAGSNVQIATGSTGAVTITNSATGATYVAGSTTQIQFNDGGTFGADADFTFDKSSNLLRVTNISGSLTGSNVLTGQVVVAGTGGLLSGSNNFWWDNSNYRVGIGTNTGLTTLLYLTGSASDGITIRTDTGPRVSYQRSNDGQGWSSGYDTTNNGFVIAQSPTSLTTTQRLFINSGGYVGVGTVTPLARFYITGSSTASDTTFLVREGVVSPTGGAGVLNVQNSAGTSLLFVSGSGNVGIGTNTPQDKAQVYGDLRVGLTAPGAFITLGDEGTTAKNNGIYRPASSNTVTIGAYSVATINVSNTTLGNQTERMRIDSSGNVGIGTNTYTARLYVSGSSTPTTPTLVVREGVVSPTGGVGIFDVQNSVGTSALFVSGSGNVGIGTISVNEKLVVQGNVGVVGELRLRQSGTSYVTVANTTDILQVGGQESTGTSNARVRVKANFVELNATNVGIGTASTTDTLAINGSTSITGSLLPGVDNTYDLGSSTKRWANVYANNVVASGSLGPAYTSPSSTSGTTALFDTVSVSTDAAVYELMITGNPNSSASTAYRDVIYGKVIIGTGNNGATVRNYIQFIAESPAPRSLYGAAGNGPLAADVVYLQAGNEFTDIAQGGTATLRVKITGYAAGFVGNNTTVRLKQLA